MINLFIATTSSISRKGVITVVCSKRITERISRNQHQPTKRHYGFCKLVRIQHQPTKRHYGFFS